MKQILKTSYRITAVLCYVVFAISLWVYADKSGLMKPSPDKGKKLYIEKGCASCHGEEGSKPLEGYPRVNNQPKEYIADQISAIKNGQRAGGKTSLMKPLVQNLTDDEIEAIAQYLSDSN